jgi:hypothetical protein
MLPVPRYTIDNTKSNIMAEVKISMMSLATVLYAALVNGDLCGGL